MFLGVRSTLSYIFELLNEYTRAAHDIQIGCASVSLTLMQLSEESQETD